MVTQASGHARSDPQPLVDSGEIVVYGVDRNHRRVILDFLAETIGEANRLRSHSFRGIIRLAFPPPSARLARSLVDTIETGRFRQLRIAAAPTERRFS